MIVDDPIVLSEVTAAFGRYEQALVSNDVHELDRLFWNDGRTLRFGATENLFGYDQIQQFRAQRPGQGLARDVVERAVTTFGNDMASTAIVFRRTGERRLGRQTQCWVRTPQGWRVVAAHVSWMDSGTPPSIR